MRDVMYEQERVEAKKEALQELINVKVEEFLVELLVVLDWDDLYYNREDLRDMIKKALGV